ncbi:MAG: polysaccharide biosynthesis protein [Deltaproteobacteria bacterium HGW-Deltaproteobacteria-14]|jgi:polysaccharide export outer membrane protein|nr:MAG: polysaccharide biosynthesis protein [Deltaproteobacteria bacterium HGW-Deltaproteobacteria-14]
MNGDTAHSAWRLRRLAALGLLLILSASAGCASCEEASTTGYEHLNEAIEAEMAKVGLGPGDVFEVTVYGEENLTRTLRVSPEGDVHFPLIDRIHINGLTTVEIETLIRTKLQDGFIREPSVTVFVKEYNSKKVFVLGEVEKPGTFPYAAGMNIVEAITLAGGFKASANTNYVVVTRRGAGGDQRIPIPVEKIIEGLATNFVLQPGDIIYVPDTLL